MFDGRIIWLAVNAASGSNDERAVEELEAAFAEAGCAVARRIDFPAQAAPSADDLQLGRVDLLVIFTGDGTVNSIVTRIGEWEGAVLVLPGGTMNILSHRLHGDADAATIVARVAAGRARRVRPTLLRSRHGDALSGVLAGPGAAWGEVREALRDTDIIGTIRGTAEAIGESAGGAMVHCREPALGRAEGYAAIQVTPVADGLAVQGFYAETIADYAKQGIALLRRNFREGPHDDLGCHTSVRLACPQGEVMGLLIDGEPLPTDGGAAANEETFTLARCAVDLLATADGG